MGKSYRLILFDCVNTLYLPDPSRLPRLELDGRQVPSTAGLLHAHLCRLRPELEATHPPAVIHRAARSAWAWAEQERGPELREVPAPQRFHRLLVELGLDDLDEALAAALLDTHMGAVTGTFTFPDAHRTLLESLRSKYRLALFSNFDHGASLRRLLEATGIADWFTPLLISDGLGWRKPGAAAFAAALAAVNEAPEAILFVGDSLEDDVRGARDAGIDVAWINPKGEPAPPDCRPTHELRELAELATLLGG